MKKTITLIVVLGLAVLFFIGSVLYKVYEFEFFPAPFYGALMGVLITAVVTYVLLTGQTDSETKKEISTKKFEKKLETYQKFLDKLCDILKQEDKICEKDLKELIFQIGLVRMHTKGENVSKLFKAISKIVVNITEKHKNTSNTNNDPSENIQNLTEHIMEVIQILQGELYTDKEYIGTLKSNEYEDSVKYLCQSIITVIDDNVVYKNLDETITNNNEDITPRFENALKDKLETIFKEKSYHNLQCECEGSNTPNFCVTSTDWEDDKFIGLSYDNTDKLYINVRGANPDNRSEYRNLYLNLRGKFGGSFNKWNWYMTLKTPYNNWIFTDEGRKLFSNPNEEMLSYISDLFIKLIEYYITYSKVLSMRYKINELVANENVKGLEIFIHQNRCLVHEYAVSENWKENIVIDIYITENNQRRIYLFDRQQNIEIIEKYFGEIITNFNMTINDDIDRVKRYATNLYNSDEIVDVFVKFRKMVEAKLPAVKK